MFPTNVMTLQHANGTPVQQHLQVQKDTVNIPLELMVTGQIPVDLYDLYYLGSSPVPLRSDYFVDEQTGEKYSVYGKPAIYPDHVEVRVSQSPGVTP